MGLFGRLLRLHDLYPGIVPEEDFLTEILGHLFHTSPETLCAWLKHLNLLETRDGAEVYVSTQSSFDPLPHSLPALVEFNWPFV